MDTVIVMVVFFMMHGDGDIVSETEMRISGFESMAQCEANAVAIEDNLPEGVTEFGTICFIDNEE